MPDDLDLSLTILPPDDQAAKGLENLAREAEKAAAAQSKLKQATDAANAALGQQQKSYDVRGQSYGLAGVHGTPYGVRAGSMTAPPNWAEQMAPQWERDRQKAYVRNFGQAFAGGSPEASSAASQSPLLQARARVLREIEGQQQQKLYEEERKKAGLGPTPGQKLQGAIGMVQYGLAGGAAAGGIALAQHSMAQFARVADVATNSLLTHQQRQRGLAESLPVVGELFKSFHGLMDAVNGTTDALRRNAAAAQLQMGFMQARVQMETQQVHFRTEGAVAAATAQAMGGSGTMVAGLPGLAGTGATPRERGYAEQTREAAFRIALAKRNMEASTAGMAAKKGNFGIYERETAPLEQRTQARAKDIASLQARMGIDMEAIAQGKQSKKTNNSWMTSATNFGMSILPVEMVSPFVGGGAQSQQSKDRLEYDRLLKEQNQDLANLQTRQNNLFEQGNQLKAAGLDLAQKESAVRKAEIASMQTELGILKSREGHIRGTSAAWGSALPAERMMAQTMLRQAKERGWESLMPQQMQHLSRMGLGELVQRKQEEKGQRDPGYRQFMRDAGYSDKDMDLAPNLKKQGQLTVDINTKVALDEAGLANKFEEVVNNLISKLEDLVKKIAETASQRTSINFALMNTTRGP